jgi:hypothetical protein
MINLITLLTGCFSERDVTTPQEDLEKLNQDQESHCDLEGHNDTYCDVSISGSGVTVEKVTVHTDTKRADHHQWFFGGSSEIGQYMNDSTTATRILNQTAIYEFTTSEHSGSLFLKQWRINHPDSQDWSYQEDLGDAIYDSAGKLVQIDSPESTFDKIKSLISWSVD